MNRLALSGVALSAAGLLAIAGYEGYRATVYVPVPGDLPTAGYGHADKRLAVGSYVSPSQALTWLKEDTAEAEAAVKSCVTVPLTQGEYDAFVSFTYNVGRAAFCGSTLVKRLNSGDYVGACGELKRWVYSGGKKYAGLEKRRAAEYERCMQ